MHTRLQVYTLPEEDGKGTNGKKFYKLFCNLLLLSGYNVPPVSPCGSGLAGKSVPTYDYYKFFV